jgi:predicted nucleotidyltransferase component of viral defense system
MSTLYDPQDRGFPDAFTTIDRAQVAMLRDLASADARLVLKGGMAMRLVVGSMRLTKDIDFDRAAEISTNAVKASVRKALTYGAQSARLLGVQVEELKVTPTTVRMRLAGTASGIPVKFVVEVSGRSAPADGSYARVTVTPPARYGIAPFVMAAYTHDMLAATKVAAIMSPNRNLPRDVYDLHVLAASAPEQFLGDFFERGVLQRWMNEALLKVVAITFDQARDELLPYLPPDLRASLTAAAWEEMALTVAGRIEQWLAGALHQRLG